MLSDICRELKKNKKQIMQSPLQYKVLSFGMMYTAPLCLILSINFGPCEGSAPAKYDRFPQFLLSS